MKMQPKGRWHRRAFVLFAVVIGGAALAVVIAGRSAPDGVAVIGHGLLLVLGAMALRAWAVHAGRRMAAARKAVRDRRAARTPQPSNPPIERIAMDLRRLLWQHDMFSRPSRSLDHAQRLAVLEAAITECVIQAAAALDVSCPARPSWGSYDRPQLRRLLRGLAAEGLVLPPEVTLLSS